MDELKQEQVNVMASRIAELERQVEAEKQSSLQLLAERDEIEEELHAACAAKDAALKPFADALFATNDTAPDDAIYWHAANHITNRHMRAARAALSPAAGRDWVPRAELERAQAEAAAMREAIEQALRELPQTTDYSAYNAIAGALDANAGRALLDELERLREWKRIGGWEQSKGVAAEVEYMQKLGRPVKYIEPE